jgi:hypothetical protein
MSKTNVPVPKVYTLCEDVDVIGTPFYVKWHFYFFLFFFKLFYSRIKKY